MIPPKECKHLSLYHSETGRGKEGPPLHSRLSAFEANERQTVSPPAKQSSRSRAQPVLGAHLGLSPWPNLQTQTHRAPLFPVHCGERKFCPKQGSSDICSWPNFRPECGEILRTVCTIEVVFFYGDPTDTAIIVTPYQVYV